MLPLWGEIAYDEKNNLTSITGDLGRKRNLVLRSNITKTGKNKRANVLMKLFLDGKY